MAMSEFMQSFYYIVLGNTAWYDMYLSAIISLYCLYKCINVYQLCMISMHDMESLHNIREYNMNPKYPDIG